jgi:prepilin-type N-terminal cleavage/methylation domain-containing protein
MNQKQHIGVSGFTLLELLVVLAIVAALAATAVPQYHQYRRKAFDMRALSDLRNVALAEELYFLDAERYLECSDSECLALSGIARLSSGVSLQVTATTTGFFATATHSQGSGRNFQWSSAEGGLLEERS